MSHATPSSARRALLSGASLIALLLTQPALGQTLSGVRATLGVGGPPITPGSNAGPRVGGPRVVPAGTTPDQAAAQAQRSVADFNAAVNAVRAQLAQQAAARAAASAGSVPDGLAPGGLAPAAAIPNDPSLWQNANAPIQAANADGTTTVTIGQTAQKAILTWDSFNVGKNTVVHFDQTGGNQTNGANNWVALNRIVDPSGKPSEILGKIKAEGSVYLINRNGIIFGGASQVDTHALIASSLSFLGETIAGLTPGTAAYDAAVANSNITFLTKGIAGPESTGAGGLPGAPNLVLGMGGELDIAASESYEAAGDVVIQAGALISTHANGTQSNGGYVLVAGNNVSNAGTVSTPDGQAILAAGQGVSFVAQANNSAATLAPTITGQVVQMIPVKIGIRTILRPFDKTPISQLSNTGIVEASRGKINLIGTNVAQNGVVLATTGVSYPGSITISALDERFVTSDNFNQQYHRAGELTLGSGSVTAMLPEEDGEIATSSPTSAFTPGSLTISGGAVTLQKGALVEAPGAAVSIAAQVGTPPFYAGGSAATSALPVGSTAVAGRVYIDDGATVDVAGLADVQLAAGAALATIKIITQNEIADDPLQAALLQLQGITIDTTLAGIGADGKAWVGSPILNASGYAQLIPRKIDQLLVNAGSIALAGGEVLAASGSTLNLDGGYVHYLGGAVATTRLVDSAGNMVAIGSADPNVAYVGIAGVTKVDHSRWGVTDSYNNPLLATATVYRPESVAGGNAGTLSVYGKTAVVLDGAISAKALAGINQSAAGSASGGGAAGGSFLPVGGSFILGQGSNAAFLQQQAPDNTQNVNVIVQSRAPQLTDFDANFNASTKFDAAALGALDPGDPHNVLRWQSLPADMLSTGGFAKVTIDLTGNPGTAHDLVVAQGATLALQPGGSFSYKSPWGGGIDLLGKIVIPSGTIRLETDSVDTDVAGPAQGFHAGSITLGAGAVLSTAGLWVNDGDYLRAPGADAFVNGGSVALLAGLGADITLQQGSLIDVSSGGVLLSGGMLTRNGVPVGKGGNVTLSTWNFRSTDTYGAVAPPAQPTTGTLAMDGTIRSAGLAGGGTLTLQALGFQIGGDASAANPWDVMLSSDFFATQGFGNFQINALYDARVADGAHIRLTQQNLIPDLAALANVPSGVGITGIGAVALGTLDPYHRQATSLTLTGGGDVAWNMPNAYDGVTQRAIVGAGASIDADAGASITLGGAGGVTVLGTIRAPGGAITLTGDTYSSYASAAGLSGPDIATPGKSIWLGSQSLLDVSGVSLSNPFAAPVLINGVLTPPRSGKVLAGGVVTLSAATGLVVAQAGSTIDVSGASATFDLLRVGADGITRYGAQPMWSDAGAIMLGAGHGLYFDGALRAQGGAAQAQGGTLTLLPETTSSNVASIVSLILQQSGNLAPDGLAPGDAIDNAAPGTLRFAVDRLNGSGISTLVLGGQSVNRYGSMMLGYAGSVALNLSRAVIVNSSQIVALPAGTTAIPTLAAGTSDTGGASLSIVAPYVALKGVNNGNDFQPLINRALMAGDATLAVNAGFIDLSNQIALDNIGATHLTSSGDIRLSSTGLASDGNALGAGLLLSAGDLSFRAASLYPASGETFILAALGSDSTKIRFDANGGSSTPLSAGGSLLVDAATIVQSGTLRAPFGNITLGVGDPNDANMQAAFGGLPLVATQRVTLANGSMTSVSAGNATLPYGVTTDGTAWSYPSRVNAVAPPLTAPPAKVVTVNGAAVSLEKGATVDLSGGGALQASEWVPGTGGTRDLLSQYNLSYASGSAAAVPLYPDARNVYAIVPGYSAPVAAYDPVFAQGVNPNDPSRATGLSVGQAGSGDMAGKAVYLSGAPGLAAGVYTLLPAKYATLPGAFRVVQNSNGIAAGQHATLADGTNVVTGYFADAITGSRASMPMLFDVQSAATWGKYSEYRLTSADTFFSASAAAAGTANPALPRDAGQLVLAATDRLDLNATLNTSPGKNGAAAFIDIASQDIQVVGAGATALDGYLQLAARDLTALDAGSLLIGGTRSRTARGTAVNVLANSIVVSSSAADPLAAPEILLVAKSDPTGTDPNAVRGVWVQSGSVITARGSVNNGTGDTLLLGDATHSGDGALLRVSNGGQVAITRSNVGTGPQGLLTVSAGASINGGAALTLDSSGNLSFDPLAAFAGTEIAVDAPRITFTGSGNATGLTGFVVGPNGPAQFASAKQVDLRSFGDIVFDGDTTLAFGQAVELSAGRFVGGGKVSLTGTQIAFTNDLSAPTMGSDGAGASGSLTINATEIDLAAGAKALAGFGTVAMNATSGIVGQGSGTFDMGGADTRLAAPVFVADTGSQTVLTTAGALTLAGNGGAAIGLNRVGGALAFTGGALTVDGATLSTPAGNLSLRATSGDLVIASGAVLSSAGIARTFYDTVQYAPAGYIHLAADKGLLDVRAGSTLDFSGTPAGGAAGSLLLSGPEQVIRLAGTIKGNATAGYAGGSLSLDTGGAIDLDNLATLLASSGVSNAVSLHSRQGNLILSAGNRITAQSVSLIADGGSGGQDPAGGNILIGGVIDASGAKGGAIALYGKSGVDLEGSLLATGSSATRRGGAVEIGTVGTADTADGVVQLDPNYGYELVSASHAGMIRLGDKAVIDVSGGTAGGLSGGTVNIRVPLLANGDVNVAVSPTAQVKGSRATTLEAFATWSTIDPVVDPAKHFDGLVDPAGWYNADGTIVAGTWTDQSGNVLTFPSVDQLADYLKNDYFTPTAANADHQSFYGYLNGDSTQGAGTLMGFVRDLPINPDVKARFANIQNFAITPGIELANPDPTVNGGNISVLTAWNLGAGATSADLVYRYNGQAPTITFKAENDFQAKASLSDGFFQIDNPVSQGATIAVPSRDIYGNPTKAEQLFTEPTGALGAGYNYGLNYFSQVSAPANLTSGDPRQIEQYYALWAAYAKFLATPVSDAIATRTPIGLASAGQDWAETIFFGLRYGSPQPGQAAAPTPPSASAQASDPAQYLVYLSNYANYVTSTINKYGNNAAVVAPAAPVAEPVAVITVPTIQVPAVADNSPSPVRNAGNPAPLETAALIGGASASFRIAAGARNGSADPVALQGATGSLTLDGHFAWLNDFASTIAFPTMIRTGTGSITIAAAQDVALLDQAAPGVIYTAGAPAAGTVAERGVGVLPSNGFGAPVVLTTGAVNPNAAGNISISAGNDIIGAEDLTPATPIGIATSQFWWQWMQTGNVQSGGQVVRSSINFAAFDQGIMSIGGDVAIAAGGNITNLAVSLPTSWYLTGSDSTSVNTVGGGDLTLAAGGDLLSGSYFVAKGTGTFTIGGKVASSGVVQLDYLTNRPVSTILAVQDGRFDISARQGANIAAVVNPSYLQGVPVVYGYGGRVDSQGYSTDSAVRVATTTGDVVFNSLPALALLGASSQGGGSTNDSSQVLPATVELTAFDGGISIARGGHLYPSPTGQLALIANASINFSDPGAHPTYYGETQFGMIDAAPSAMPSPLAPVPLSLNGLGNVFDNNIVSPALVDHSATPLHAGDTQPVRIYSLTGSIINGVQEESGAYDRLQTVVVDKPAQIYAGQDIINLDFVGQNLRQDDITRIVAGRDILAVNGALNVWTATMASLVVGGTGVFDVEAGRNITIPNPAGLSPAAVAQANQNGAAPSLTTATGIVAVGNSNNPYLPHESADIDVLFGVGKGVDNASFVKTYVDPTVATPEVQKALVAYMEAWDEGKGVFTGLIKDQSTVTLSLAQAWGEFQALPAAAQQRFNRQAMLLALGQVGADYNDPSSPYYHQYARGYQAINTLFPASMGYTANSLNGGEQGAQTLVHTGDLDVRSSTIQTQQGGSISILGPGGGVLVGGNSAPPVSGKAASTQGILTLEQGGIDIFTDTSVLLAQSRIFTEQGGAITIWSSNGDINAGKGAKTNADVPQPIYVCDADFYCTRDARGQVSGAGIATLQTIPGAPSADVELVAPRGTVDFGAAGVRSSANLIVAAQYVVNASNAQVQGQTIGVPTNTVNVSTNLAASNQAAAAATQAAEAMQQARHNDQPSLVIVTIDGFGPDN